LIEFPEVWRLAKVTDSLCDDIFQKACDAVTTFALFAVALYIAVAVGEEAVT
jgi:hypothetical protein